MTLLALVLALAAPASGAAFRPLGFKEAKAAAAAEKKSLLVYAVSNSCVPCERMHRTTLKDPAVLDLLARKTVAIEFNADQEPALGKALRVTEFPTTILFASDGKPLDRILGFQESKPFIGAIEDALAGRSSVDRARKAMLAARDPHTEILARHALAKALMAKGRSAEALEELLWLYDEGAKAAPKFADLRSILLPVEIAALGRYYPPAIPPLRARRSAVIGRLKTPAATQEDKSDLKCLDRALAQFEQGTPKP